MRSEARLLLAALALSGAALGSDKTFVAPFDWKGNHAVTVANGAATTVWWNEDAWDVRCPGPFVPFAPFDPPKGPCMGSSTLGTAVYSPPVTRSVGEIASSHQCPLVTNLEA